MSSNWSQAMMSVEIALDHALTRLNEIDGEDRIALEHEYREWLADDKLKEKVWFSIDIDKSTI